MVRASAPKFASRTVLYTAPPPAIDRDPHRQRPPQSCSLNPSGPRYASHPTPPPSPLPSTAKMLNGPLTLLLAAPIARPCRQTAGYHDLPPHLHHPHCGPPRYYFASRTRWMPHAAAAVVAAATACSRHSANRAQPTSSRTCTSVSSRPTRSPPSSPPMPRATSRSLLSPRLPHLPRRPTLPASFPPTSPRSPRLRASHPRLVRPPLWRIGSTSLSSRRSLPTTKRWDGMRLFSPCTTTFSENALSISSSPSCLVCTASTDE